MKYGDRLPFPQFREQNGRAYFLSEIGEMVTCHRISLRRPHPFIVKRRPFLQRNCRLLKREGNTFFHRCSSTWSERKSFLQVRRPTPVCRRLSSRDPKVQDFHKCRIHLGTARRFL